MPNIILLDEDSIWHFYGNDLGYKETDRYAQITRIQNLTSFLEKQTIVVVVATLYSYPWPID